MVDTNSDPRQVDFVIPSNDDASKSINKVLSLVTSAIADGLTERKSDKAEKDSKAEKEPKTEKKQAAKKKVVAAEEEE
jgi:small subunit ribosomal protein S2